MERKKPQFSKVMVGITTVIFVGTLLFCLCFMLYMNINRTGEFVDYVVCTTALTVVSGLYGLVLKNYLSKSGLENVAAIRKGVYKEIMDTRLEYDARVLELRQQYNVEQYELDDIENNAPFKNLSDSVIGQTTTKLDQVDSLHEEEPETQMYG